LHNKKDSRLFRELHIMQVILRMSTTSIIGLILVGVVEVEKLKAS